MIDFLEQLIRGFNVFVLGYFLVLQLTYTALAAFGWRAIEDYVNRRPTRDYDAVGRSEMSMPVSILVPAYNEAPTIVSCAFGLFRRDIVVEVGGYDPNMVGEDAELILRLHRHHRERSEQCRITFFPDPICWTECPEAVSYTHLRAHETKAN